MPDDIWIEGMHSLVLISNPAPLTIRLFTTPPPFLDTQFCGHYTAVSPFAWQSNKAILFYFTQNSVSEIQFGVRVQRLDSASVAPPQEGSGEDWENICKAPAKCLAHGVT